MLTDRFKYFTFSCFECSLNDIEKALLKRTADSDKYVLSHCSSFTLDMCPFKIEPPRGGVLNKVYYFTPLSNERIVVMLSNCQDGWITSTGVLSKELNVQAYKFSITNIDNPSSFNSFTHWGNGDSERVVYSMKDPRWKFYAVGPVQWFEQEDYYTRPRIKDRLNKEILISYCKKLGMDFTNDNFWKSNHSLYFERIKW